MKTLKSLCLAIAALSLSACVNIPRTDTTLQYQDQSFTRTQKGVVLTIPSELKNEALFVEVERTPTLTQTMRNHWKNKGYQLVDFASQASVVIKYAGYLQENRNAKNDGFSVWLGDALEKTLAAMPEQERNNLTEQLRNQQALNTLAWAGAGQISQTGALLSQGLGQGFTNFSIFQAVSSLTKATGISDAINKATAGDRRGKCLTNCQNWHKTGQLINVAGMIEYKINGKKTGGMVRVDYFTYAEPDKDQWGSLMNLAIEELPKLVVDSSPVIGNSEQTTPELMGPDKSLMPTQP